MFENEEKWTLDEVINNTRNTIQNSQLVGEFRNDEDLSYLTQELLNDYWTKSEVKEISEDEFTALQSVASYWGNRWAHISQNQWAYTNNNTNKGCDPVNTSTLCGSGKRWKVRIKSYSSRYCANGAPTPRMAWAR